MLVEIHLQNWYFSVFYEPLFYGRVYMYFVSLLKDIHIILKEIVFIVFLHQFDRF